MWFECWLGIVMVWPYKCGLVLVEETNQQFSNFESIDISEIPKVTNYSQSTFLIFGSFLIWHYLASAVSGMCNFVIERAVASFFFSDYEKRERNYIGYTLVVTSQCCVTQSAILLIFHVFHLKSAIIITTFLLSSVILTFILLLHYNTSLRNWLDLKQTKTSSYNLAARFQAAENARSLKLAMFVFSVICIMFIMAIILLIIMYLRLVSEKYNYIIMTAFECLFSLNPLFIVPAAMYSVPEWKEAFLKSLPFCYRNSRGPGNPLNLRRDVTKETNLYFVQLEDSWKIYG